ncbi:lipid-binding protein [Joostella atrarenae]|uniref:Lipid-binding protein n=1 Tax=Joostella atrarenae TaxID=679257 RepID=A0ABS9IZ17_9FLAO|nr:START domain-containing protein [Joostella atrarenae]MCF8713417.1 lipid-binding protein [Joostella atrarenae]
MKPLFVICFLLIVFSSYCQEQEWELKRNTNNIQVYTRELDSTKINEYKAILKVNTSLEKVLEVLTDGNGLKNWNYKTPESELIAKISETEFIVWMQNDLPWPISDRDNISRVTINQISEEVYKIDISPADSTYIKANKNVIRMDNFKGNWLIRNVDKNTVEITQQMYGDPNGNLPAWLINSILTTFPYHSFEKLKGILEN